MMKGYDIDNFSNRESPPPTLFVLQVVSTGWFQP
jgi:hypothetical protein